MAAHTVVGDLEAAEIELGPEEARHLVSALRLRPGETVGATDGRGGFRRYTFAGGRRLVAASERSSSGPRRPALAVGLVAVKGDRTEWAVQKLTEVGVDRILLLAAERAVVRWEGERLAGHLSRLEKVARAAVGQSRGLWMPVIEGPVPVGRLAACPAAFLAVPGGPTGLGPDVTTVLIGPEGGWAPGEVAPFEAAGRLVGLGPGVLRAETAAVAAGVLLSALRAGVVAPGRSR